MVTAPVGRQNRMSNRQPQTVTLRFLTVAMDTSTGFFAPRTESPEQVGYLFRIDSRPLVPHGHGHSPIRDGS